MARSTSPASCNLAISCGMAGCVTPSRAASQVNRHGPDRSSVASVAAAVSDNPFAGLSDRNTPNRRSSTAATPAASVSSSIFHKYLASEHISPRLLCYRM